MNKIFFYIFIITFLTNCSIDNKSGIWSDKAKKEKENKNRKLLSKTDKIFEKEFNANIKIKINENFNMSSSGGLSNNYAIQNYSGDFKEYNKFKFTKIENFSLHNPQPIFNSNGEIIFFDGKGTVFKLDKNLNLIWKTNLYTKKERKMRPILNFALKSTNLVISDNLSNIYLLNSNSGKLIWKKKNNSPFNSQIKIFDNKIFLVDLNNTLKCMSLNNGSEIWQYKSETTLIKSLNKISLITFKNKVVFLNSIGDLNALNTNSGNLLWQSPLINTSIYEDTLSVKFSEIVLDSDSIYVSNNNNEFFSINANTGAVKWRKKINSSLRPTITKDLIFTITPEGFLIILNKINGKIIRSTNLKYDNKEIKYSGFAVSKKYIYLAANNKLKIIKVLDGKVEELKKISGDNISQPYISNKSIYIFSKNIIKKY